MDDEHIRRELMGLIFGGYETTAAVCPGCVARCPPSPTRRPALYDEVDALGGGRVGDDDLERLPWPRACFDEAQRLQGFAINARQAAEDDEIGGYAIPKGTIVAVSGYTLHRDPRFWASPTRSIRAAGSRTRSTSTRSCRSASGRGAASARAWATWSASTRWPPRSSASASRPWRAGRRAPVLLLDHRQGRRAHDHPGAHRMSSSGFLDPPAPLTGLDDTVFWLFSAGDVLDGRVAVGDGRADETLADAVGAAAGRVRQRDALAPQRAVHRHHPRLPVRAATSPVEMFFELWRPRAPLERASASARCSSSSPWAIYRMVLRGVTTRGSS